MKNMGIHMKKKQITNNGYWIDKENVIYVEKM